MSKVFLANEIQSDSIVDGEGLRAVVWFQGCSHACKGCHNPETHPFNIGLELELDDVYKMIDELVDQDGITFSGGDPMFQPKAFLEILKYSKSKGFNTWCYTGFLYDELLKMDKIYQNILSYLDVLVDGKFDESLFSLDVKYRGSKNQRIIDLNKTRESGSLVTKYDV